MIPRQHIQMVGPSSSKGTHVQAVNAASRWGHRIVAATLLSLVPLTAPNAAPFVQQLREARVVRVIDGDTFVAQIGTTTERVRLIGVDTPEATTKVEPYGREATAFARRYLDGKRVWLEYDVELRDRYSRRLAYVWLSQPSSRSSAEIRTKMFNAILLSEGYAQLLTVPPNVRYVEIFRPMQVEARERGKGLWGRPSSSAPCDPSYPDVCIPPPPPDLDCRDIAHRRFRVLPPDPHNFDGDGDGVGCER